jgi:4-diphosphocytidyl-2-C-methyl-D-erythritol kinase
LGKAKCKNGKFLANQENCVLSSGVENPSAKEGECQRFEAPAKINLTLSVHGRRPDGFHALTSLIVGVDFGDSLEIREIDASCDRLICEDSALPKDDSNLVLKAARLFRQRVGEERHFEFRLIKRIPVGAGLGGGSSDVVAALKGLDALTGRPLGREGLLKLAAELGSDCPFFVDARPALMRGRGEVLELLDEALAARLRGRRLVLFRPPFGVDTRWAYTQLAKAPDQNYTPEARALKSFADFQRGVPIDVLLSNSFEAVVGRKYIALPALLETLRQAGCRCLMSGSGSCCFALPQTDRDVGEIEMICRNCWGEGIFWVETSIS